MFRLQVTIIRQTFQYMDRTCSVLTVWDPILFTFDMIYLLTEIGLSLGGSTHLHTNSTWNNTNNNRTTQIQTNVEECGPCPVFSSFTLAFALQLREKDGKTSVTVRKTLSQVKKNLSRSTVYELPKTPTQYKTHTHTHTNTHTHKQTHTHTHTLQNYVSFWYLNHR
jgi:hypothetical protein